MKAYKFVEPHETGGHATVVISEQNILKYMKEHIAPHYKKVLTDKELVENFCVNHWAEEI